MSFVVKEEAEDDACWRHHLDDDLVIKDLQSTVFENCSEIDDYVKLNMPEKINKHVKKYIKSMSTLDSDGNEVKFIKYVTYECVCFGTPHQKVNPKTHHPVAKCGCPFHFNMSYKRPEGGECGYVLTSGNFFHKNHLKPLVNVLKPTIEFVSPEMCKEKEDEIEILCRQFVDGKNSSKPSDVIKNLEIRIFPNQTLNQAAKAFVL